MEGSELFHSAHADDDDVQIQISFKITGFYR
jgi:hypothetical protein